MMKTLKKVLSVVIALTLVLSLAACSSGNQNAAPVPDADKSAAPEAEYVWKAGSVLAPDHPYSLGLYKLAELLEEKSGGRIKMDVFPSGQMGGERDMIEGIQLGTLDFVVTATAPVANFSSQLMVFDLPYLFRDTKHVYTVEDGPIGQSILDTLQEKGIRGMNFWECGFMEIANTKRKVLVPDDLKGMNIRVMENPIYIEYFTKLGANPVPMALTEVFTSLQNGTIDAVTNPVVTIYTSGFHTVAKDISLTNNIYIPAILLMSQELYTSLPKDIQAIVTECCNEARDYERSLFATAEVEDSEKITAEGGIITEVNLSDWNDAAFLEEIYKKFVPSQIPQELVDQIRATK